MSSARVSRLRAMASEEAASQLKNFALTRKGKKSHVLTTSWGAPIGDKANSLTVGRRGPILLQDRVLLDELAHFDRERIPERAVHAKGAGAFGYFETTHDVTAYTKAAPFSEIGKRTPVALRFSTVSGENGSADTVRSPRGFAVKFYTEEGNWDLAGNNTPIFFIRDPILFPSFLHTQKRNPVTHLKDIDGYWDFMTLRPETMHQLLFTFSPRGIPDGYRYMHGFGSHTFKLINKNNEAVYCKFHFKSNQGVRNLCPKKATELAGSDPDYALQDLYNAIARGEFPSWTLNIQVMTFAQAEKFRWNPFDMTKVWPQAEYPLIPVGKLVLDRNPRNHFAEVEQLGFCPAHMIPGIEASPDKMLQGRLFSYTDTLRHRLGTNFMQIPVNCPYRSAGFSGHYQRDGPANVVYDTDGAPNYFPNSFSGPEPVPEHVEPPFQVSGDVDRYDEGGDADFEQPRTFWNKILSEEDRQFVIRELAASLKSAQPFLQERALKNFVRVCPHLEASIRAALEKHAMASKM